MDQRFRRGLAAGTAGALLGGVPSTVYAAARRQNLLEAAAAAGALALPDEHRPAVLAAAGVPVHLAVSLAWGVALSYLLPHKWTVTWGAAAGTAIAIAVRLPWSRSAPVGALPFWPQLADHIAFATTVAYLVRQDRSRPPTPS